MNPHLDQDTGPALSAFMNGALERHWAERERLESIGPYRGPLPIGYRRVKRAFGWEILPDERDADNIRLAFLLAARPGTNVVKVREEVTCRGLRNHSGVPLSADRLRLMLADPFYAGLRQTDGGLLPGGWKPLVDAATFAAVQRNLAERRRGPRKRAAAD